MAGCKLQSGNLPYSIVWKSTRIKTDSCPTVTDETYILYRNYSHIVVEEKEGYERTRTISDNFRGPE